MQPPPSSPEEQLQWLVDRAQIHDLLVEHARRLDNRDWHGLQELFAEDGWFEVPFARVEARDVAARAEEHLGHYHATRHLSANYAITIDGDEAHAWNYVSATHVRSADDPFDHADVGGGDETIFRRVDGVWRIASRRAAFVWKSGAGQPGEPDG